MLEHKRCPRDRPPQPWLERWEAPVPSTPLATGDPCPEGQKGVDGRPPRRQRGRPAVSLPARAQAPGVPARPMRGASPSLASPMGVCRPWATTTFSSTTSHVGLVKADKGRLTRCISRS